MLTHTMNHSSTAAQAESEKEDAVTQWTWEHREKAPGECHSIPGEADQICLKFVSENLFLGAL